MTPKETAEELVERFLDEPTMYAPLDKDDAKQCALICVDEIIKAKGVKEYDILKSILGDDMKRKNPIYKYWQEVEQEVNKL